MSITFPTIQCVFLLIFFSLFSSACQKQQEIVDIPNGKYLIVASSNYDTGQLSAIHLNFGKVYNELLDISSDASIAKINNRIYIIQRKESSIIKLKQNWQAVEYEKLLAPKYHTFNPHNIAEFQEQYAFITLFGKDYIGIIDLNTGNIINQIPLTPYIHPNDSDRSPDASNIIRIEDTFYVLLGNIDINKCTNCTYFTPILLEINTSNFHDASNLPITQYNIPYNNPWEYSLRQFENTLTFVNSGRLFFIDSNKNALDGAFLSWNMKTKKFHTIVTENNVSANIHDGILLTNTSGFLSISKLLPTGETIESAAYVSSIWYFDISGEDLKLQNIIPYKHLSHSLFLYKNTLFIMDRNPSNPGIISLDISDISNIKREFFPLTLPPIDILFIEINN